MKRFFSGLILWVALIATFATSVYFQNIGMHRVLRNTPFYDTWQLGGRSGDLMKLFALRYDMVAADFLWLRSIQSFGGRGMSNRDWRPIYNQFDTMTDLDPYFKDAYTFGNLVIGDEGGHNTPGLKILNKGTFNVYRQYRIPFEAMYVAHWQMKNEKLARWYGVISSQRIDAPNWVNRMVAYIDVASGEYYIGLDRFIGNLMQGIDAEEPAFQNIALDKSAETINKWNASILSNAADEYTSRTGHVPQSIDDLLDMPSLQTYETASMARLLAGAINVAEFLNQRGLDPEMIEKYVLPDPQVLAQPVPKISGGKDEVTMVDYQDVVFRDSLTTVTGLPPGPTGEPYVINTIKRAEPGVHAPEDIYVPKSTLENSAREMLATLRSHIARRKDELGRTPESLDEVFYTDFKTTEPFGGQWQYDPQTGTVKMSSRPSY